MRDIGKNIRTMRIQKKMTQDQLAERLFVTRQTVSNYETGKSRPDIDTLLRISEVLDADIHQLIYGIPDPGRKKELLRTAAGIAGVILFGGCLAMLAPTANRMAEQEYLVGLSLLLQMVVMPMLFLTVGWTLAQTAVAVMRVRPAATHWTARVHILLLFLLLLFFLISLWVTAAGLITDWQEYHGTGGMAVFAPKWISGIFSHLFLIRRHLPVLMTVFGAACAFLRFPESRTREHTPK